MVAIARTSSQCSPANRSPRPPLTNARVAPFRLYNTMTRQVEPFAPADGETVRLYTCGPTVYNPAHLGNFRTFLFEDLLRRALELYQAPDRNTTWKVEQVMNLTDVDDKIIAKASAEHTTIDAITEPVIHQFFADCEYLRIRPATHYPRATQYIPQMIALVEKLVARGLAYPADDGSVYFAIRRFPAYGRLSRLDLREVKAGAGGRVAQDDYSKEDAQDFALWKAAKPEDEQVKAAWSSPWGRGRPGWHLECSAMAMAILGETLDLHCGGVDLIFPHHDDEIAQSEGATGVPFSRAWCHGQFLLTDGVKMAKRVGNVITVSALKNHDPPVSGAAIRHLMFTTHYRRIQNLTDESFGASVAAVAYLGEFAERVASPERLAEGLSLEGPAAEMRERVHATLFDDLDAPGAVAAVFEFVRKANLALDSAAMAAKLGKSALDDAGRAAALQPARDALALIEKTLAIVPEPRPSGRITDHGEVVVEVGTLDPGVRADVEPMFRERLAARGTRDFARADAIRDELALKGFAIADGGSGTRWKKLR